MKLMNVKKLMELVFFIGGEQFFSANPFPGLFDQQ